MTKRSSQDVYDPEARLEFLRTAAPALRARHVFVHYTGGVYMIEYDMVKHTETEEVGVVYRHLWPHCDDQVWYRPLNMFFGPVLVDGEPMERFAKVDFDAL